MPYQIAPPLIAILGARAFFTRVVLASPPSFADAILNGALQGITWYHVYAQQPPEFSFLVGAAVVGKLALDVIVWEGDTAQAVASVLGMALGVLLLDVCTRFLEVTELPPPEPRAPRISLSSSAPRPRKERTVQFRKSSTPARDQLARASSGGSHRGLRRIDSLENSIITAPSLDLSLPSISEVTDSTRRTMTSLEREVSELRTRASLADTERRRFREEKKWAESQGNRARAEQMKWNIKRYTALMESFNREADLKIVERACLCFPSSLPHPNHSDGIIDSKQRNGHSPSDARSNALASEPIFILPPR